MYKKTNIPVLLLHNIDNGWDHEEIETAYREIGLIESSLKQEGHPLTSVAVENSDLEGYLKKFDPGEHVVLNWCESLPGVPRSEAIVAQTLESFSFAYTGSPPDILRACWDKCSVKRMLEHHGIPTPRWEVYASPSPEEDWGIFPAIVKPAYEHCSYGVTSDAVVTNRTELHDRIAYVLETFQCPALVEDFIDGREFHVSLWGNGIINMLPPAEMDFRMLTDVHDRLCTYDAKFKPGSRHYEAIDVLLPAPLGPGERAHLETTARAAYAVMGCRDYARLDIRLRDGVFYVLDINPNPDISSDTSMAAAAALQGYSYGAMLSKIVNLAAMRHPVFGRQ
ncbi:MAG: hypothetical protein N3B18_05540 [Desulfobacterota bacterium]|nr:hypothetical protein [Thermodesulfobacteriota bacterium]